MKYELNSKTQIEVRRGLQSAVKPWAKIGFIFLGVKNAAIVGKQLAEEGIAEFDGVTFFHPEWKK